MSLRTFSLPSTFFLLALLVSGCSSGVKNGFADPNVFPVTGNWQISSSSAQAVNLPLLSGSLSGDSTAVSGLFHATAPGACIAPQTIVSLRGAADYNRHLALTSAPFADGSVLTMKGTLAPDGHSLTGASYLVTGGACAFPAANGIKVAPMQATQFQTISGNYTGTFTDEDGTSLPVTATLTQTTQPDANGMFHLTGNASFPGNPCLTAPVITDSTVTGSSLSATYSEQQGGTTSTVVAAGTFNADASVLTITNWTLSAGCGADNGTGVLTKQ